jgi:hypothetical protein
MFYNIILNKSYKRASSHFFTKNISTKLKKINFFRIKYNKLNFSV